MSADKLCVAAFVQLSDLSPLIDIDLFLSDHASCLLFFPLMVLFQLFTVLVLNHCRTLCGLRYIQVLETLIQIYLFKLFDLVLYFYLLQV